jgi:hypothetical protein
MVDQAAATALAPPLPLLSRITGVLFSPRETFASIVAHPRWLDVLAVTTLVAALGWFLFLSTSAGQQAFVDQQITQAEGWGQTVNEEMISGFDRMSQWAKYFVPGVVLVATPLITAIVALILLGYGAILGGGGSYKQLLAIAAHASVPTSILATLVMLPLNYMRESMTSATSLAVFFPSLPESSFLGSLFGWIDLFAVWWIVLLAIGLSVLYKRKTGPIALTLLGLYLVIALIGAAVKSSFAGGS